MQFVLQVSGILTAYVNCHTDHGTVVVSRQTTGLTKDFLLKKTLHKRLRLSFKVPRL